MDLVSFRSAGVGSDATRAESDPGSGRWVHLSEAPDVNNIGLSLNLGSAGGTSMPNGNAYDAERCLVLHFER